MGSLLGGSSIIISSTGSVQVRGGKSLGERGVVYQTTANGTSVTTFGVTGATTLSPGAAAGAFDDVFGHQIVCQTGAVSGQVAGVTGSALNDVQTRWEPRANFLCAVDVITTLRLWVGLFSADPSASDSPAAHILGFRYSTSASDPAIMAVAKDGTTINAVSTGVAMQANAVFAFRIEVASNGTSAAFYVNDTLTNTLTTNLPTTTQFLGLRNSSTTLSAANKIHSFYHMEAWESAPPTAPVSLV